MGGIHQKYYEGERSACPYVTVFALRSSLGRGFFINRVVHVCMHAEEAHLVILFQA